MKFASPRWLTTPACLLVILAVFYATGSVSAADTEEVAFENAGWTFAATFYPPEKKSSPGVLLLHMMRKDRHSWKELAPALQEAGYGVLAFDLRGHGETRKGATKVSYQELGQSEFVDMVYDVAAAKSWLERDGRVDTKNLALIGASIGANVSLQAAATDSDVKLVVLLSPGINYRSVTTVDAIQAVHVPILLVASQNDTESYEAIRRLYDLAKDRASWEAYAKAGHGTDMFGREDKPGSLKTKILELIAQKLPLQAKPAK